MNSDNNMHDQDLFIKSSLDDNMTETDARLKKSRSLRDAQAHRMIEKRRRDRMNSCLSDLDRLIQASLPGHRQGRVEKTEIIEMAIQHINILQNQVNAFSREEDRLLVGYKKCRDDAVNFLVEKHGQEFLDPEALALVAHLQNKLEKLHSEVGGSAQVTSTQTSRSSETFAASIVRHPLRQTAASRTLDVKPELMEQSENNYLEYCARAERRSVCKTESNEPEADKLSMTSSSSSDALKIDSVLDTVVDWTFANRNSELLNVDSVELRKNRRRSFSECTVPPGRTYKFKNNLKVRFRKDSLNGFQENSNMTSSSADPTESGKRCCSDFQTERASECPLDLAESNEVWQSAELQIPCSAHSSSNSGRDQSSDLPAFVLYPGYTFYVPMSLPVHLVAPFLQRYNPADVGFPINITVNFCGVGRPSGMESTLRPTASQSESTQKPGVSQSATLRSHLLGASV